MKSKTNFTEGKILSPLLRFTVPVLVALALQAMYGAVDLIVVGQFGTAADVCAVSTGSQLLQTITMVVTGLAMGTTILLGQKMGEGRRDEAGDVVGSAVMLFSVLGVLLTCFVVPGSALLAQMMHVPAQSLAQTINYLRICASGLLFIVFYNLLGSIFRGMGNARTPLFCVIVACIVNIAGDLFFVAVLGMATAGAALATVLAQAVSVLLCVVAIRKEGLPFAFGPANIRPHKALALRTVRLGFLIALQDGLVSISFLVLLTIVNGLGVVPAAGVGVAEKLCAFIMLVPSAYMQSLSAFVAQNIGAQKPERAKKAMACGMASSLIFGLALAWLAFFHGDLLAGLFARDTAVITAAAQYLRAYALDTLLVSFLFCFCGYFNGCGKTVFVMVQGIIGAFGVRIPVAYCMSRLAGVTLFEIGLSSPISTAVQITLCFAYYFFSLQQPKLSKH